MDRQIVYAGAIPLETDLLNTNKYTMIGLAKLASAIMGSSTYVRGLSCTPSSPASMIVNVSAGEIYSLQNVDGTAYSSLAADTTHSILKQGILMDSQSFTLTAPTTSGYSINYLIQTAYTDTDSGATVLPYYNASNPSVAWSGPNNTGASQNTVRSGACVVSLKAGAAATTGTQTTPAPDAGYTGLYVITVAQGATTVTTSNISLYPNAPFLPATGLTDGIQKRSMVFAQDTGTANAYVVNVSPGFSSLAAGMEISFRAANANTGSATLNVCGTGTYPVLNKYGATLTANEIVANSLVKVIWSPVTTSWFLLESTNAIPTVPTAAVGTSTTQTASTAYVMAQAALQALLGGSSSQTFNIAQSSASTHAVRRDQFVTSSNGNGTYYQFPGGSQFCRSNVTAPANGSVTWTYPLGFASAPQVFYTTVVPGGSMPSAMWINSVGISSVSIFNPNSSASQINVMAFL